MTFHRTRRISPRLLSALAVSVIAIVTALCSEPKDRGTAIVAPHRSTESIPEDQNAPILTVDGPERFLMADHWLNLSGTITDDSGAALITMQREQSDHPLLWMPRDEVHGEMGAWHISLPMVPETTVLIFIATDEAGNQSPPIRRLAIAPPNPSSGADPLGVDFIWPLRRPSGVIPVSRTLTGVLVYAQTVSGLQAASVRYRLSDGTNAEGNATLRPDGDWEVPELLLPVGKTTLTVIATNFTGETSQASINVQVDDGGTAGIASTSSTSSGGGCGAGSGLSALVTCLALMGLRRRLL